MCAAWTYGWPTWLSRLPLWPCPVHLAWNPCLRVASLGDLSLSLCHVVGNVGLQKTGHSWSISKSQHQVPHGGVGKGTMSRNRWLLWGPYCGSSFVLRALSVETHLKFKPSLLVGTVTLLWQMVTSKHRLCIASKCEEPGQEPRQSGSRACVLSSSLWGGLGSSVWYHFCY